MRSTDPIPKLSVLHAIDPATVMTVPCPFCNVSADAPCVPVISGAPDAVPIDADHPHLLRRIAVHDALTVATEPPAARLERALAGARLAIQRNGDGGGQRIAHELAVALGTLVKAVEDVHAVRATLVAGPKVAPPLDFVSALIRHARHVGDTDWRRGERRDRREPAQVDVFLRNLCTAAGGSLGLDRATILDRMGALSIDGTLLGGGLIKDQGRTVREAVLAAYGEAFEGTEVIL